MQEQIRQKYEFYNFAKHQNINLYSEKKYKNNVLQGRQTQRLKNIGANRILSFAAK